MKIILLENVTKIGKRFDIKEVKSGFARNLLFPKNLAVVATKENIARYQLLAEKLEKEKALEEELLLKAIESLNDSVLTVYEKANKEGHLFKGIGKKEVVKILEDQKRVSFDESVIMLNKPIKTLGEHRIPIQINNKEGNITLSILQLEE